MSKSKLDALLKPLIKPALKLTAKSDKGAIHGCCSNKFGGMPYGEAQDQWPVCAMCKDELTFIVQIEYQEENRLFCFFYCWQCFSWGGPDELGGEWIMRVYENPKEEKRVELVRKTKDEYQITPCTIETSTVNVLPAWEVIDENISDYCCEIDEEDCPMFEYFRAVVRNGCLNDNATLLHGYPRIIQNEIVNHCPICNSEMEFLMQIDSEAEAEFTWGDCGLVYFYRCKEHKSELIMELQCD